MKKICSLLCLLLLCACHMGHHYEVYHYDNGEDYAREGLVRIVDPATGKIGYATPGGEVVIAPQYAFGHPFHNGVAKVTHQGHLAEVEGSHGEYHSWQSPHWFYIDKHGYEVKR